MNTEQIRRFWKQVDIIHERPDCCWEWKGYRKNDGYGRVTIDSKDCMSHRVAYQLKIGQIPDGMLVCHSCDNPPCCNPSHLFVGSHSDNMKDMASKKRGKKIGIKGDANIHSKLSDDKVYEMRSLYLSGMPTRKLVKLFGLSRTQTIRITNFRSRI